MCFQRAAQPDRPNLRPTPMCFQRYKAYPDRAEKEKIVKNRFNPTDPFASDPEKEGGFQNTPGFGQICPNQIGPLMPPSGLTVSRHCDVPSIREELQSEGQKYSKGDFQLWKTKSLNRPKKRLGIHQNACFQLKERKHTYTPKSLLCVCGGRVRTALVCRFRLPMQWKTKIVATKVARFQSCHLWSSWKTRCCKRVWQIFFLTVPTSMAAC